MGYGANNQQCFGHLKMTMRSAIAEIRESFDVMDSDKVGYIDVERLQTICLGLGYGRIAVDELASMVSDRSHITLKDTVSLLSKVLQNESHTTTDSNRMDTNFALLDADADGLITSEDLFKLANEVGDPLSRLECESLMGPKKQWTMEDLQLLLS